MDNDKNQYLWWFIIFIFISRYVTHIVYIEDIDSMRFALSTINYDLTLFQPHFPAYPIYCFITKIFYWLTGNVAISHYISGSIGMSLVIYTGIGLWKNLFPQQHSIYYIILLSLSPLLWLMSNRFMPDIMGLGLLLLATNHGWNALKHQKYSLIIYCASVSLLAGVRISYLPFLLPLSILLLIKQKKTCFMQIGTYIGSSLLWLIPLIIITGWQEFTQLLINHSQGHFNEWGGTVITDNNLLLRLVRIFQYLWSDGLGGWFIGRSFLLIPWSILLLTLGIKGFKTTKPFPTWLTVSLITYFVWVFLFQNVLYKPRHLMPFVPFFLLLVAKTLSHLSVKKELIIIALFAINIPNTIIAYQHKHKSAVAQAGDFLSRKEAKVICNPLVTYYLQKQYPFIKVNPKLERPYYSLGSKITNAPISDSITFYHNPYINRMWDKVKLYYYE